MLFSNAPKQTGPESVSKVIKSKEFVNYARQLKKTTVVRQIIAGSVILRRGRACPLRRTRWRQFFNQVLLGGKVYLKGTAIRVFIKDSQV